MSKFALLQIKWFCLHEPAAKAQSLVELDALFATLQHRAFRGEL